MANHSDIKEKFLIEFRQFEAVHANGLSDLRSRAIQYFKDLGIPTSKNEEWKYTNILPAFNSAIKIPASDSFPFTREEILKRLNIQGEACLILLENGKINPNVSDRQYPDGFEIKSLASEKNNPVVKKHFSKYADMHADAFAALNTAFYYDGVFIRVPQGIQVPIPVILVNISTQVNDALVSHGRILLVAEKNSSLKLACLSWSGSGNSQTFVNSVNELVVEENAGIEISLVQSENEKACQVCNTFVYQESNSRFTINTLTTGGSIVRNKLHINLDGENCDTHLYGLYIADKSQLIDNHTAVFHSKPHSKSNQLYKGIVGGKAHGVFNGKIMVEKDAQKTNAYQSNKNILLSNDAVINAKPQLEIFADDVKCTHGATTGQMDDEALFYLRSRGINEVNAKTLLNKAFASDIINKISIEWLRENLNNEIESKLIKANAS